MARWLSSPRVTGSCSTDQSWYSEGVGHDVRLIALPAGFAPVLTPRSTCRRISVASSHRSAMRTNGTSPADAIRFASENEAETCPAA
jgi:hypothetical protein